MTSRVNTERGQVSVSVVKGLLNLQIPSIYAKEYYNRKQYYLSFGARDTRENMVRAQQAALELQRDMQKGTFDPGDINKYKHPDKVVARQYGLSSRKVEGVLELYDEFVSNLRVSPSTMLGAYAGFRNHIVRMIDKEDYILKQQLEIKSWIEKNVAPTQAQAMLEMFHRMIEWGNREERLPLGFASKFKVYAKAYGNSLKTINTKRKPPKGTEHLIGAEEIDAWSEQERDIIIAAFHSRLSNKEQAKRIRENQLDYKAYLVEFMFLVGCRHGEGFALTWADVSPDFKRIRIDKSYSSSCRIIKGTKTGKVRTVPMSIRAQDILRTLKPINCVANSLVFPNREGKCFSSDRLRGLWNPSERLSVIGRLIREGKLTRYLPVYSTRHTFVSLQISKGASVVDVAQWVGDNPETILKHYARYNREAVPF